MQDKKSGSDTVKRHALAQEIGGVFLVFASLFLLLALLSYTPADALGAGRVSNWAGPAGFWPVHYLVSFAGIAAYVVVFLPAAWGISLVLQSPLRTDVIRTIGFVAMIFAVAGFSDLAFQTLHFDGRPIDAGGWLGTQIRRLSIRMANRPGSYALFSVIFLTGFIAGTGISILTLLKGVRFIGVMLGKAGFTVGSAIIDWATKRMSQKRKHKDFIARQSDDKVAVKGKPNQAPRPDYDDETDDTEAPAPVVKSKPVKVEIRKTESPKIQQELGLAKKTGNYELPPLSFLDYKPAKNKEVDEKSIAANSVLLTQKLRSFGVEATVVAAQPGPVVTMYELEPAAGVKVNKFVNLSDDLAMAMKTVSIRVVAPIPGKNVVGIEIPNNQRETVYLKEIIGSEAFKDPKLKIPLAMGKDISGNAVVSDLGAMPHLLVAGSTGSGKSVSVNSMICSVLYRFTADQVKFVMIDPKMIELSAYDGIPHLRTPVITNPKKAAIALRRCVDEMERRYELMKVVGRAKDLDMFNKRVAEEIKANGGKPTVRTLHFGDGPNAVSEDVELAPLPYWIIIIDELADLMVVAKKDIEDSIARLTAKARAAGLHLIVATQRPSVDVITGVIKSNLPTRLSFQVASAIDSRTILDTAGADNLLGQGDSLFIPPKTNRLDRVHGAYVSEDEIARVVDFLKKQGTPIYDDSLLKAKPGEGEEEKGAGGGDSPGERDALYDEVVQFVMDSKRASTSAIQRKYSIGYNRAARILDQMQEDGLVGPPNGSNPREILRGAI